MREYSGLTGNEYFGEFLAGLHGRLLIPYLKHLNCDFGVQVTDTDDPLWIVHVREGRLVNDGAGVPQCTFTLDSKTLGAIVSGAQPPEQAFFEMKVDVIGDMELGLKLSTVLAPFFRRYPYRVT